MSNYVFFNFLYPQLGTFSVGFASIKRMLKSAKVRDNNAVHNAIIEKRPMTELISAPTKRDALPKLQMSAPPRGIIASISGVLLRPRDFFKGFSTAGQSWLLAALFMMALTGYSAVPRPLRSAAPSGEVPIFEGSGIPGEFPLPPGEGIPPTEGGTSSPDSTWSVALAAIGNVVIGWGALATLLMVVPMFNGKAPDIGRNLQIVIWASAPLAVMKIIQLVFINNGGQLGATGMTGFLNDLPFYTGLAPQLQRFVHAFAGQITLFSLWSAVLVYLGARYALHGRRWIAAVVVILWVALVVIIASFASYDHLLEAQAAAEQMPTLEADEFPLDEFSAEGLVPDGIMPSDIVPEISIEDRGGAIRP